MSGAPPSPEFSLELIALLPRLRRYARVLTGEPAGADDLVQDTLERALERHHQWQPGSDLRAWLFSIMHNRRIDVVRRDRYTSLDDDAHAAQAEPAAAGFDTFESIDLQRAFERLGDEHREVLALVAIEQLSYEEAAGALGVPIGTVMSRLSRARQRLRALLAGEASGRGPDRAAAPQPHLTRIK